MREDTWIKGNPTAVRVVELSARSADGVLAFPNHWRKRKPEEGVCATCAGPKSRTDHRGYAFGGKLSTCALNRIRRLSTYSSANFLFRVFRVSKRAPNNMGWPIPCCFVHGFGKLSVGFFSSCFPCLFHQVYFWDILFSFSFLVLTFYVFLFSFSL